MRFGQLEVEMCTVQYGTNIDFFGLGTKLIKMNPIMIKSIGTLPGVNAGGFIGCILRQHTSRF
jgi:hypothetical protein